MDCHQRHVRRFRRLKRQDTRGLAILVIFVLLAALGESLLGPSVASPQRPMTPVSLVFDGVTVIDVEHGQRLSAQRVVIVGNRIKAMGGAGTVRMPAEARVIDARGKYLIPGLWDMHTHAERHTDIFYPMFLANGVTGIRDAGSNVPLDTLILWRREILAGTRVGPPRQILSGQSISGPKRDCQRSATKDSPQTCVADSADARHYVDSLKAAGADMIKLRAVDPAMYFVAAAESRRVGIPFGGHTEHVDLNAASDSGASIIDHFAGGAREVMGMIDRRCWTGEISASIEQCQSVADRFTRNGTWLVPTLVITEVAKYNVGKANADILKHHENVSLILGRLRTCARAFWAGALLHGNWLRDSASVRNTAGSTRSDSLDTRGLTIAKRVGMPMLAGTDVNAVLMAAMPPGLSLLTEVTMYQADGLTPLDALQTATLNPAKLLHATDSLGTVAPGKLADLVLLDADPLADVANVATIRAVVANGRYFDRAALDQLLTEVQVTVKQNPSLLMWWKN